MEPLRSRRLPALVAFLLPALAAFVTRAPTVTGGDAGEYVAAAALLGNVHPPGNPVYTLLAGLATWLPLGDACQRVALVSALCLGATGWAAYRVAAGITGPWAALGAAWAACAGANTLAQASVVEVYPLQAWWALLVLGLGASRAPGPRRAAWFLVGLGLGVHATLLCLVPALALTAPERSLRRAVGAAGLLALGGSVFLYAPLRSMAGVAVDYGHPGTWDRLLVYVGWADYAARLAPGGRNAPFGLQIVWTGWAALRQLPAWVWVAAPAGFLAAPGRRRLAVPHLGFALCYLALVAWAHNYPSAPFTLGVAAKQLVPLAVLGGLWGGIGAAALLGAAGRLGGAGAAALGFAALAAALPAARRDGLWAVRDVHEAALWSLPGGTTYLVQGDAQVFPLLVLREVEGQRPDVSVWDRDGRFFDSPYRYEQVPAGLGEAHRREVEAEALGAGDRPVAVADGGPRDVEGLRFRPWGFVYLAAPGDPPPPRFPVPRTGGADPRTVDFKTKDLLATSLLVPAEGTPGYRTALDRALAFAPEIPRLHLLDARLRAAAGDLPGAAAAYRRAAAVYPLLTAVWWEWGRLLYDRGRYREALAIWDRGADRARPVDPEYFFLLGNAANRLGLAERALRAYADAARLGLDSPSLHYNAAVALLGLGRRAEALERVHRALALAPGYEPALNLLRDLGGESRPAAPGSP
ncbi:MAG: DUF2723 domain-containing protein [Candidatus Dadabacteria bacterium]|nr:MAG: DUF2723 domain-containing protein [Candidatus Dadabacteria bacterium]